MYELQVIQMRVHFRCKLYTVNLKTIYSEFLLIKSLLAHKLILIFLLTFQTPSLSQWKRWSFVQFFLPFSPMH